MAALGAVPERARVGDRARGLQRQTATPGTIFPHDHARSRAYRWGEDGLAGICDDRQTLCFALAFWNGRDPILKERIFGLTGPRGQPRRGRQGVLVLPRLDADALVDALALQVPAGASSPTTSCVEENRARGQARARVRAGRHRDLRRGSLLGDHGRLRQGLARTICLIGRCPQRRAGARPRSTSCRTLWFRNTWSWGLGRREPSIAAARRRRARSPSTRSSAARVLRRRAATPRGAVLRERDQHRAAVRASRRRRRTPRTASTTTSCTARATRQPGDRSAPRPRCATARSVAAGETVDDRAAARASDAGVRRRCARRGVRARRARGRRVLRRADTAGCRRRRGARAAPGVRRHALVQAVLPLRRASAGSTAIRPGRRRRRAQTGRNREWRHLDNTT